MKLEDIGFYTLSDERAKQASIDSPLWRGELILTGRCNFKCPYCRHVGGNDLDFNEACEIIKFWASEGLKNIRFSGGEPTLYPRIVDLVYLAKKLGIENVAISTNGSASLNHYLQLYYEGVNDFSISLDACCAEDGDRMAGGIKGSWEHVTKVIAKLASLTYVTVGIVLTDLNIEQVNDTIRYAHNLGVADIRIIPAAQAEEKIPNLKVDSYLLDVHPILKYRVLNLLQGKQVRGLGCNDPDRCGLVNDDVAVMGNKHYPCIIYLRENGKPIGELGPMMRQERTKWAATHNTQTDPICKKNCIDVCVEYNRKFAQCNNLNHHTLIG
jgi:MoaA/NifB/PqqE/SkfB family radical SAM enzyme